jgi:hypothetical protein
MTPPTATRPALEPAPAAGSLRPLGTSRRTLRAFVRPYRRTLALASGLTLVETLLDLARPWPLKVAVDNAIVGRRWVGRWVCSTGWGRPG